MSALPSLVGLARGHALPAAALVCLLAAGCGYHLRGSQDVDMGVHRVQIVSQRAQQLADELQRTLVLRGVRISPSRDKADAVITVSDETYERRVLSVDADTGKVREFEMDFKARVAAHTPDGAVLLDEHWLALQRDFTFDENAVLGKFQEENALRREMREDAAETIVRRLAALKFKPDSAAPAP